MLEFIQDGGNGLGDLGLVILQDGAMLSGCAGLAAVEIAAQPAHRALDVFRQAGKPGHAGQDGTIGVGPFDLASFEARLTPNLFD